jgi:hypothetical protein
MAQPIISSAALQRVGARFRGTLIGPDDAAYERARQVWNGAIDRRPALIARCMGAGDVIAALELARDHHLPVAVRGGGHSVAGHGVCDGGLVVDLSAMKGLLVDPQRRMARAEPGLTAGELLRATLAVGLALPTGAGTETGIAGLTLGGGIGWLGGLYGLTCDSLQAVEIVTADGRLRTASAHEHPHLFWAVRGGGGNFGVVTSLTFQLQAVGPVLSGLLVHPLARAHEVLAFYRAVARNCPDKLTIDLGLLTAPDGQPIVGLLPCYAGPLEAGERALAPLRAFGPPVADLIRPMTLLEAGELVDAASPWGRCYCFRAQTLAQLTDAAIATIVAQVAERPSPFCHAVLRHVHGAATRVAPDATAVALRQEHYCLEILAVWTGDDAQRHTRWAQRFSAAMAPFAQPGVPVNFLGEEGEARVQASYGANYARLVELKNRCDPTNVFCLNQNIRPTVARGAEGRADAWSGR